MKRRLEKQSLGVLMIAMQLIPASTAFAEPGSYAQRGYQGTNEPTHEQQVANQKAALIAAKRADIAKLQARSLKLQAETEELETGKAPAPEKARPVPARAQVRALSAESQPQPSEQSSTQRPATEEPKTVGTTELNEDSAKLHFIGFEAAKSGSDPQSRALLYGMVFDSCKEFFSVTNSSLDKKLRHAEGIGFMISDPTGKGRECQDDLKNKKKLDCNALACTSLHQLPGGAFDIREKENVKIGLLSNDKNNPRQPLRFEQLTDANTGRAFAYKSESAIKKEREDEALASYERAKKKYQDQVKLCRGSNEDLTTARNAAEQLVKMRVMTSDEYDRLMVELTKKELALIEKKIEKVDIKNSADVEEIKKALEEYRTMNADKSKEVDELWRKLALRALPNGKRLKVEDYDLAKEILEAAKDSTDSEARRGQFDRYIQDEIEPKRLEALARKGATNMASQYEFQLAYQNAMTNAQANWQDACFNGADMMGCYKSQMNLMSIAQTPMLMQQVMLQQYQMQQQMQRQMMQMQQSMMGGMGGNMMMMGGMGNNMMTGGAQVPMMQQQMIPNMFLGSSMPMMQMQQQQVPMMGANIFM